jgi:hypothetical protein
MSERIASQMVAFQPDEWARILNRVERGEVYRLYVFVTHYRSGFGTFVYAPGDTDNTAEVLAMLGAPAKSGWIGVPESETVRHRCAVSMFDIGPEVCAAVQS